MIFGEHLIVKIDLNKYTKLYQQIKNTITKHSKYKMYVEIIECILTE